MCVVMQSVSSCGLLWVLVVHVHLAIIGRSGKISCPVIKFAEQYNATDKKEYVNVLFFRSDRC